ncbi:hypothetical protein GCM10017322_22880 [Paracoccus aerius]|nr:hypothetical protein GCM10017322_22880 [Paracoccus aerius]
MDRLTAVLSDAGMPPSFLGKIVKNDPNWVGDYRSNDFRVGTYDRVVSRMSAIWPDHLPWPDDVPRPEPAQIEPSAAADAAEKFRLAQPSRG